MRVCMITTFYPPYHFGGDAIYIYRLANALARHGHAVELIHCVDAYNLLSRRPPAGDFPHEPNVVVHRLKSQFGALSPLATQQTGRPVFKAAAIRAIIERGDFDLLHYHNISLIGAGALAYGRADAIRLYTMHEYWLVCPMHMLWKYGQRLCERPDCLSCQFIGRRPPQLWRYGSFMQEQLRRIDTFIAPSRASLRLHRERGLTDLPIRLLPYFVPDEGVPERNAQAPATGTVRPYFLFVGRLEWIKGVQDLIETFRSYRHADLLIAGEGGDAETLRALARDLPHVHFLGGQSWAALRALYREALALLVPSIWHEVFGIITLEAFAARTPVIVRRRGALPEIVAESGGGLTYDTPQELIAALERLQGDPALRERLGAQGHATYRARWSEEPHLHAYFALVREAAARRGLPLPATPAVPGRAIGGAA